MRLGIVTTWFERGAAYVSRQYAKALSERHDVFIYARGGEKRARENQIWDEPNVHWGRPVRFRTPSAIDRHDFVAWIRRANIDALLFNEQHWWRPVVWAKDLGIPTLTYVDWYTPETVELFASFDGMYCNTLRHFSVFEGFHGSVYVPWGTDVDLFEPPLFRPDRPLTFFHSAGWDPYRKGTDIVLRAMDMVPGNSRLLIHSQTQRIWDVERAIANGLAEAGRLQIHLGDVPAPGLYSEGDVYLYPSRSDGIGLTLVEALACGLPVITTDEPPMSEFATGSDGICSLVPVSTRKPRSDGYYWGYSEVNPADLAAAMAQVRRDAISAMSSEARHLALTRYSWSDRATQINDHLEWSVSQARSLAPETRQAIVQFEKTRSGIQDSVFAAVPQLYTSAAKILKRRVARYE